MFDIDFDSYFASMRPEMLRKGKGRPPDKIPRYALQKARKRTEMKKASRRRNRK